MAEVIKLGWECTWHWADQRGFDSQPALVVMTTSRRSSRHLIGCQFVSEWPSRWWCWCGSVCTSCPTTVCILHLRMVVISHVLQSLEPFWCPGLGRLMASTVSLCMAPEPGTKDHRSPERFLHSSASPRPICSSTKLVLVASCTVVRRRCGYFSEFGAGYKYSDSTRQPVFHRSNCWLEKSEAVWRIGLIACVRVC